MNTLKTLTEKCDCKKFSCLPDCSRNHTHKTFSCPICTPPPVAIEKNFLDVSCPTCGHIPTIQDFTPPSIEDIVEQAQVEMFEPTPPSSNAQPMNWEEEFEEQFEHKYDGKPSGTFMDEGSIIGTDEVKQFIRSLLLTQKKELQERYVGMIDEIKEDESWCEDPNCPYCTRKLQYKCPSIEPKRETNQALTHAQQLIRDDPTT